MSDIEKTIWAYLNRSAGNCNWPSDHTLRCFLGMIETGEADWELFDKIGGEWLTKEIKRVRDGI